LDNVLPPAFSLPLLMKINFELDTTNYSARGYLTPNQIRDELINVLILDATNKIKNAATQEQARRKGLPDQYIECPYCKGYHDGLKNVDGLCEKHEQQMAAYRYDTKHFGKERALELYHNEQ